MLDLQRDHKTGGLRTSEAMLATPPLALRPVPQQSAATLGAAASLQSNAEVAALPAAPLSSSRPAAAVEAPREAADELLLSDRQEGAPEAGSQQPDIGTTALSQESGSLCTCGPATAALPSQLTYTSASDHSQQVPIPCACT